jgi:ribose 5-phosphate isomerase B
MLVFVASDHAGYNLKTQIWQNLKSVSIECKDLGTFSLGGNSDFSEYALKVCDKMKESDSDDCYGILICGSGMGMCMAANRHNHIRCALCRSTDDAIISREHNNANVCALGARFTGETVAHNIVKAFLNTQFLGGRYKDRMDQIS